MQVMHMDAQKARHATAARHSFENATPGHGVIGRALDEPERASLIEYLKTL